VLKDPVNLKNKSVQQVAIYESFPFRNRVLQVYKLFWISEWMLFWLLAIDVLRVKQLILDLTFYRSNCMLQEESPAESLVKLILFSGKTILVTAR